MSKKTWPILYCNWQYKMPPRRAPLDVSALMHCFVLNNAVHNLDNININKMNIMRSSLLTISLFISFSRFVSIPFCPSLSSLHDWLYLVIFSLSLSLFLTCSHFLFLCYCLSVCLHLLSSLALKNFFLLWKYHLKILSVELCDILLLGHKNTVNINIIMHK